MEKRFTLPAVHPAAWSAMMELSKLTTGTSLNPIETELVKIRASQVNGCAFCIDMHTKDARKKGETEQRIYTLNAWRDTGFFSDRERALLALTEEVTLIQGHVKDETFKAAVAHFGEKGTAEIIMAIVIINAWNRIAISTGMQPV
ncbi:MAG: carboxymuconolactone decarboxylase family protein [Chitinophagaceae bacterium]|nr:MAG: carboxymuconolactone decarboxylase family protein [Chitinophagaceae bacterium]